MVRPDDREDDRDDAVWRSIVENYGDRAELEPADEPGVERRDESQDDQVDEHGEQPDDRDRDRAVAADDADRFVPPDPPPLPRPPRDRLAAWTGVFGAPAVLLVCVVAHVQPPALVSYALVAAFIGGFCYLVLRMPHEPRDPWDDGAQL